MIEISKDDKRKFIHLFDNITDLANFISKNKRKEDRDNSSETGSYSFTGTSSYKVAFESLKYGDEELYKKVKDNSNKINIDKFLGNVANRLRYKKRIYGAIPNVPAYLIGNPINMINPEKTNISHRILNIFLDMTVLCDVDAEDIIRNGVMYLKVIDLLEKKGYRCNLYAGTTAVRNGKDIAFFVKIKTDKEPLNIKKVCFPIASPSMLRRIGFRWQEVIDVPYDATFYGGYGKNMSYGELKNYIKGNIMKDFILWSYSKGSKVKTIEEILEELKKQGIKILED